MTAIERFDADAAALQAKAAEAGLSLEAWLKRLAGMEEPQPSSHPCKASCRSK
jgi:hypothetical protein